MTLIVMLMMVSAAGWAHGLFPTVAALGQARPPLLAAVVVFYAIHFPAPVMVMAAILAGSLYDANSLMPLGSSALYYCAVGTLIQTHRSHWARGGGVAAAMLTALTAGGQLGVVALAAKLAWDRADWLPGGWARHLLALLTMGTVTGVALAKVAKRLHRMTGTLEELVNP